MSAIFDFASLLTVLLLLICTCTYLRELRPTIFDNKPSDPSSKTLTLKDRQRGIAGFCWKLSRIGERLSPYIAVGCLSMAIHVLFLK